MVNNIAYITFCIPIVIGCLSDNLTLLERLGLLIYGFGVLAVIAGRGVL